METRQRLRAESAIHILGAMHRLALAGDTKAAQLVLKRCLPAMRPGDDPVETPVPAGGILAQQAEAITARMLAGSLSPAEATDMLTALAAAAKVVEASEMAVRMAEVERLLGSSPHGG